MKKAIVTIIWCVALAASLWAQPARFQNKSAEKQEKQEGLMVISNINRPSLAFRSVVISRMLEEANWFKFRNAFNVAQSKFSKTVITNSKETATISQENNMSLSNSDFLCFP